MLALAYIRLYFFVFALGCVVASFLNVLVYRLPRKLSPWKGRSFCPGCAHQLHARDLIPLLSFLSLQGKCRYCGQKISPRYAIVETAGGLMAMLSFYVAGAPLFLLPFACACVLLTISLIDADTQEIPDGLIVSLAVLALAAWPLYPAVGILSRAIGVFAVSVPLLVLALIIPGAFGGGDIKLMAAAGFLLGWQSTLLAMFIALLTGGGFAVYLLAGKKTDKKAHIAFGPFLCLGIWVAQLFGAGIIGWYASLL